MKSRLPAKSKSDELDAFITGADDRLVKIPIMEKNYPWKAQGVRDDVAKVYNLRLSEPYLLKLKYIAEHTPNSMQKFCLNVLQDAIDAKIKELIERY
jgi:hypothetical protein